MIKIAIVTIAMNRPGLLPDRKKEIVKVMWFKGIFIEERLHAFLNIWSHSWERGAVRN